MSTHDYFKSPNDNNQQKQFFKKTILFVYTKKMSIFAKFLEGKNSFLESWTNRNIQH